MYNYEQLEASIRYLQTENRLLKKEVRDLRELVNGLLFDFYQLDELSKKAVSDNISEKAIPYLNENRLD